jgi:hypothetical protein
MNEAFLPPYRLREGLGVGQSELNASVGAGFKVAHP